MIYTGMVSVTFRKLDIDGIVDAASRAGLDGIEWGGDVHVPHGDIAAAHYAAAKCADAGLRCFSYGSYYRAGQGQDHVPVIETAAALGAPNVRIWAGVKGSAETSVSERAAVTEDIRLFADEAADAGLTVSFEWHGGTLTDTPESALRLVKELIDTPNVFLYWQPNQFKPLDYNLDALRSALPHLSNIHVFNWDSANRYPLRSDGGSWRQYLDIIRSNDAAYKTDHGFFLEFSPGDSIDAFYDDARYLKLLINKDGGSV